MSNVSRRELLHATVAAIGAAAGAVLVSPAIGAAPAAGHLSNDDIIRAWKDEGFRRSLTAEQAAQLPDHPSGGIEVSAVDLGDARGAGPRTVSQGVCNITCKRHCCVYSCGGR
jgi:mersacidin/lichenicidin family type 2 lantibiotic